MKENNYFVKVAVFIILCLSALNLVGLVALYGHVEAIRDVIEMMCYD